MLTDKSAILAKLKLKTEDVEIDGEIVRVSELNAEDYYALWTNPQYQDENGDTDSSKFLPALVARTIVDESGNRIFTDDETVWFRQAAKAPYLILCNAARRLNGLSGDETKN